jgi:hypothetical protein
LLLVEEVVEVNKQVEVEQVVLEQDVYKFVEQQHIQLQLVLVVLQDFQVH